ncbi:MAG: Uma2 family endonuclease [Candidatus Tectomicrobia bacterium]|uniref:Uma2 family endonuclease n=1 Tax=Tectimicrobiota bacterium TaxID=2528274 RepID=A0A937W073_UNCTE|nr:Uma2 family endonuclease [Candidatus Tectomicrobia bacterium]
MVSRCKDCSPIQIWWRSAELCSVTDQVQDVVLNPRVIVEVLSPSTEAFDRGEKFHRYRRWLPTLTDYVLVAQDRPVIDHYQRTRTDRWEATTLEGLDTSLHLPSIACTAALVDVYERIVLPSRGAGG